MRQNEFGPRDNRRHHWPELAEHAFRAAAVAAQSVFAPRHVLGVYWSSLEMSSAVRALGLATPHSL
jgi:hypothetical protein